MMRNIKNIKLLLKFIVLALILTGAFNIFVPSAEAVIAMPGVRTHVQDDGTVVYYQAHGDEFLNYMTDSNGDLVAFAQDGDIYLARWTAEDEKSSLSTVPTTLKPISAAKYARVPALEDMRPLKTPIPRHHLDNAKKMSDEISEYLYQLRDSPDNHHIIFTGRRNRDILQPISQRCRSDSD